MHSYSCGLSYYSSVTHGTSSHTAPVSVAMISLCQQLELTQYHTERWVNMVTRKTLISCYREDIKLVARKDIKLGKILNWLLGKILNWLLGKILNWLLGKILNWLLGKSY